MDKLSIARMVANNPHMQRLTRKRAAMYNRMRADYGREFMGLYMVELPSDKEERTKIEMEENERGKEGVNRWTPVERAEYLTLERRITGLRTALMDAYAQTV